MIFDEVKGGKSDSFDQGRPGLELSKVVTTIGFLKVANYFSQGLTGDFQQRVLT